MTALTENQLLDAGLLLQQAARTALDDFLRSDLVQAVDICEGEGAVHAQNLLRPIVMRDDHCRAAQGMLCRAITDKLTELNGDRGHFHVGAAHHFTGEDDPDALDAVSRRMNMMLATVSAYLHNAPEHAWQMVAPCTTADRLIVIGFTCSFLNRAVSGRVLTDRPDFGQQLALESGDDQ